MNAQPTVPPLLAANPRLDRWVGFPGPGRVTVSTGRVEIGQGVLTAMLQIAAEELDVAPERILLQTGDTDLTPNEGYTAGSQSIQFGGVALRLACAEVRALFLDHAAASLGYSRPDLSVWVVSGDGSLELFRYRVLAVFVMNACLRLDHLCERPEGDAVSVREAAPLTPGDQLGVGVDDPRQLVHEATLAHPRHGDEGDELRDPLVAGAVERVTQDRELTFAAHELGARVMRDVDAEA